MPFFEDIDNSTIVERHIRRLTGLELEQSRRLQRLYIRARNSLRQRLAFTPQGTFTEAQITTTLAELEQVLANLKEVTRTEILLGAQMSTEQAREDLIREANKFRQDFQGISQPLPVNIILETLNPDNFLINQYATSLEAYDQTIRAKIQRTLGQAALERVPLNRVINRMENDLATEEYRLLRIARTELHNIYNVSKMKSMVSLRDSDIPKLKKTIINPMDSRTGEDSKFLAAKNPIVEIEKPFKYTYKGQKRTFMAPPDRPNDRGILVPYSSDWDS